jgi:hypothetical protein
VKEHFLGEKFELADYINTAVTASLHHLSKDAHNTTVDRLPHRLEKIVDSVGH